MWYLTLFGLYSHDMRLYLEVGRSQSVSLHFGVIKTHSLNGINKVPLSCFQEEHFCVNSTN